MSQDIVNKNQDISYTNLDFSSIYTEIIDLAKQLSYRWDPSISDESDPGVVLLKLNALIADKMNYNIDKSVLEAFPLSVTQDGNARQLYEQLGYYMNWYESAIVPINFTWLGEQTSKDVSYTIPAFTIITDSETSRSYALIGTVDNNDLVVSDAKLPADGSTIQMVAMEGTPTTFSFLGETKITSEMVDENNRLYFETKYVSQNGIFIRNSGNSQANYLDWKRVDNLYEQPYDNLRYKFGIDSKSDVAYIEFPDNYAELIGAGIEIVYMIVDPDYSNIPPQTLDRFLVELVPKEDSNIILTTDNVKISNPTSAAGHKNIESIDEAYVNYKRTVGTFKTLITLRDYINYILLEGEELYSNGFVTDRSNDPQLSYKIMSTINGIDSLITEIETDDHYESVDVSDNFEVGVDYYYLNGTTFTKEVASTPQANRQYFIEAKEDKLTPFDLKFYLLQDVVAVNSNSTFNQTFEMIKTEDLPSMEALIEDSSHIEHTYKDILPLGENTYKPTLDTSRSEFKSYYKKNGDRYEFISNVYYILTDDVDAYYVPHTDLEEFEEGVEYFEKVGNEYVLTSDTDPESGETYYTHDSSKKYYKYNTQYGYYYVVDVKTTDHPEEMNLYEQVQIQSEVDPGALGWYEIDVEALSPHIAYFRAKYPLNMTITTYSVVGTDIQADIKTNILNAFYQNLNSTQLNFGEKIELDYLTEIVLNADTRIKSVVFDNIDYMLEAVYYDKTHDSFVGVMLPTSIQKPNYAEEYSVKAYDVCKDIFAKSILAGTTKLLDQDTKFTYHLNQSWLWDSKDIDGIYSLTSETTINMNKVPMSVTSDGYVTKNYTLKSNEVVNLLKPKLVDLQSFQTGVHYEYLIEEEIYEDEAYQLSDNEYFIFYVSILDENKNISGYTTRVYTNGAVIKPEFYIEEQSDMNALSSYFKEQLLPNLTPENEDDYFYVFETQSGYWTTSILNNTSIMNNVIQGSDSIVVQKLNRFTIEPEDGYKFYWVLSDKKKSQTTGKKMYQLFGEYDSETQKKQNSEINTYTLKSGETLYYMNKEETEIIPLGAGTTITRNGGLSSDYMSVDEEELFSFININSQDSTSDESYYSFNLITTSGNLNPRENGLYEEVGTGAYKPTEDTYIHDGKSYYVLTMNSVSGLYQVIGGEPFLTEAVTYDIFEEVDIDEKLEEFEQENKELDPSEAGYYERVNIGGVYIEDNYLLEGEPNSALRYRYVKTLDTSVFSETVFKDAYENFEVNDVSNYASNIEINENNKTAYNPSSLNNNLYEIVPPEDDEESDSDFSEDFYEFYEKVGNPSSYVRVHANINSIPIQEGWYEKIGEGESDSDYTPTQKIYSYKPTSAVKSQNSDPFVLLNGIGKNTEVEGFYYKFAGNEYDNNYILSSNTTAPVTISSSSNDVPTRLKRVCERIYISNPGVDININTVDSNWSESYSTAVPSSFYYRTFKLPGENEVGDYRFITLAELQENIQLIRNNFGNSLIFPSKKATDTYGYFVSKGLVGSSFAPADTNLYVLSDFAQLKDPENDSITDANKIITNWYEAVSNLGSDYMSQIPLYLIPNYYKFLYLVSLNDDKYYKPKIYEDKLFGTIDPWECEPLDLDLIANDPAEALNKMWRPLQENCSITLMENDTYSLKTGDTLSIIANESSAESSTKINYPIITNSESILYLDNYDVTYTTSNNVVNTIDMITIPGVDWRIYSNLLVNTSNAAGQTIYKNQSISFNDEDGEPLYVIPDSVPTEIVDSHDIIFQLTNPVSNRAGSNIQTITTDDIGNEIPNNAYVFYKLLGTDNISYLTTFDTLVTVPKNKYIEVPFNQTGGTYIIPINVSNDKVSVYLKRLIEDHDESDEWIDESDESWYDESDDDSGDWYEFELLHDFASGDTDFDETKTYYLDVAVKLDEEDNRDYSLVIVPHITSGDNTEVRVTLGDLFKYEKSKILTEISNNNFNAFEDIFTKMKRYDSDSIYNYTFQPDVNDIIENPLDPKMVWNKNHVYNAYTIPQLDLSSADNINYRFITSK